MSPRESQNVVFHSLLALTRINLSFKVFSKKLKGLPHCKTLGLLLIQSELKYFLIQSESIVTILVCICGNEAIVLEHTKTAFHECVPF